MKSLAGKVALVTGASRGVGKGIAIGLGEAGATVYVTGRQPGQRPAGMPGTVEETARAVTEAGGPGIALFCDHRDDEQARSLFDRIEKEQGRLDILVNNCWGGYENIVEKGQYTWELPFWQQPLWRWDNMFGAGVRAAYVAGQLAVPLMLKSEAGLIVNISYWAAQKYMNNVAYGVAKAATDKLSADMAHDLRGHNIAAVSLYPGLVRTEGVLEAGFDLSNSESPQFSGRVIAALAVDPALLEKSGRVLVAAALAEQYRLTDIDGQQPRPLTRETA